VWLALRGNSSSTTTTTATVPTVTGLHEDEAMSQLTGAGFQVGLKKVNTRDAGAVDIVSAQDPAGNAVVPAASKVTISVGQLETVPVPDVLRQTVARANAELKRLGFTVRIATIFTLNRAEIGLVLKQSPGRGAKEPFGSAVTIGVGETKVGAFRPTTTTAG
jgi:beta-lactam-binding protein with PASTA domain